MTIPIKIATSLDQTQLIAALTLAFNTDPIMRWMYPTPHEYLTYFPVFAGAFGGRAIEQGTAYYIDGYSGAALWLGPNIHPDFDAIATLVQQSIAEKDQALLFAIFEQMAHYHITEPHWYLPLMGVEPTQQRLGCGAALIKSVLEQCDRDQIPAYLESTKPENIPFYERRGFELIGTVQMETAPPVFSMLRKPQ
jgi:GNAT superfamily N-acetyltransferase